MSLIYYPSGKLSISASLGICSRIAAGHVSNHDFDVLIARLFTDTMDFLPAVSGSFLNDTILSMF